MAGGKSEFLFSGQVTTNSYVGRNFNVRGFGETQIIVDVVECIAGQTLSYKIAGYPNIEKGPAYSVPLRAHGADVTDITVESGDVAMYKVGSAFDKIIVSVKNTTSNKSGIMTVTATGKRRQ